MRQLSAVWTESIGDCVPVQRESFLWVLSLNFSPCQSQRYLFPQSSIPLRFLNLWWFRPVRDLTIALLSDLRFTPEEVALGWLCILGRGVWLPTWWTALLLMHVLGRVWNLGSLPPVWSVVIICSLMEWPDLFSSSLAKEALSLSYHPLFDTWSPAITLLRWPPCLDIFALEMNPLMFWGEKNSAW